MTELLITCIVALFFGLVWGAIGFFMYLGLVLGNLPIHLLPDYERSHPLPPFEITGAVTMFVLLCLASIVTPTKVPVLINLVCAIGTYLGGFGLKQFVYHHYK